MFQKTLSQREKWYANVGTIWDDLTSMYNELSSKDETWVKTFFLLSVII